MQWPGPPSPMSEPVRLLSLPELRRQGFEVLVRELGPADALRFQTS